MVCTIKMSLYHRIVQDWNQLLQENSLDPKKRMDENVILWLGGQKNQSDSVVIKKLNKFLRSVPLPLSLLTTTGLLHTPETNTVSSFQDDLNIFRFLEPYGLTPSTEAVQDVNVLFLNLLYGVLLAIKQEGEALQLLPTASMNPSLLSLMESFETPTLPMVLQVQYYKNIVRTLRLAVAISRGDSDARLPDDFDKYISEILPLKTDVDRFIVATESYINKPQLCITITRETQEHKKEFSCKVHQNKCAKTDCYTWVDIGYPYCKEHLASEMKLEIKTSTNPDWGLGVFAYDPTKQINLSRLDIMTSNAKKQAAVFQEFDVICDYDGEHLSQKQFEERYRTPIDLLGVYIVQNPKWRKQKKQYIDAACLRGVGSIINHQESANCIFVPTRTKVQVQASRKIFHGQELYVNYGESYFWTRGDKYETKACI